MSWQQNTAGKSEIEFKEGVAIPTSEKATLRSTLKKFDKKQSPESIVFEQSPIWQNWQPIENLGPSNLGDAPVLLSLGPDNYWMFGRYGYHAWQSKDMVNWVHHGSITDRNSAWMTSAEFADGKAYFYYDFPNDQDPHLYIDDDLFDGMPGKKMGMAFNDPSHGSDSGIIRDLEGKFHLIVENQQVADASQIANLVKFTSLQPVVAFDFLGQLLAKRTQRVHRPLDFIRAQVHLFELLLLLAQ